MICLHLVRSTFEKDGRGEEGARLRGANLFFLSKEVRVNLAAAAFILEGANTGIRVHQLRAAYGQPVIEKPIESPKELITQLEFCNKELQKWRKEHAH